MGVEIPCSGYASNVPLQINTGIVNLDFKGGIRLRVVDSEPVALVPAAVVTVASKVPRVCAGVIAVICVGESTVNEAAAVPPKLTAVVPSRSVDLPGRWPGRCWRRPQRRGPALVWGWLCYGLRWQ